MVELTGTNASGLVLDVMVEDGNLAADGGYASAANLADAKSLGVAHVAFHKPVGLTVEAMISYLKRYFGLSRCNWKGLDHFKAYVHSAVVTHNLVVLTRRLAPT